jgi:excisionase family DNA binding protein
MTIETSETRRTVNVREAATILGISTRHAYDMAREGQLPVIHLGSRIVVPRAALERLLEGESG